MPPRVVVTGVGPVTAVGVGRRATWEALLAGRCGFSEVGSFDTRAYKVHRGAEVRGFRADEFVRRLSPAAVGRTTALAIAAARLALEDAGLDESRVASGRGGVVVGTTSGEPQAIERFNDRCLAGRLDEAGPELLADYPSHIIAARVAAELGLAGVTAVIPAACAAGNYAIAYATEVLQSGRADLMLAGGADSFSRITYTGFARLGAIAPDVCQPFDRDRKGMIPGEGAALLVLERLEQAAARGAEVYAEVAGWGLTCDAHHMTGMDAEGEGAARAMRAALRAARLAPADVSYVSAHGTGTVTNDRTETKAVKRVFGECAGRVPISSVKSMLGHSMGAASAVEAAVCALAVRTGRVPPTMNLHDPDPECDLDYVPNRARELPVRVALNNAYGFGGSNSSLVLKRLEG
jgi:3-oxoacyl-[acyl-carrier-protein] synthase II